MTGPLNYDFTGSPLGALVAGRDANILTQNYEADVKLE
jgi:hypothetical protein